MLGSLWGLVGPVRPGGKSVNVGSHSAIMCKRCAWSLLSLRAVMRSFRPTVEGADDGLLVGERVVGLEIEIRCTCWCGWLSCICLC